MSFLRKPAWVGSLTRPAASSGGFVPGPWSLVNLLDFEDGGADGTIYVSPVSGISVNGDYAFPARVWVDASGHVGKSVRFAKQTEIAGSNNSHYRGYLTGDATYISSNSLTLEGRITFDLLVPPNPNYRGMGGVDPSVWFFGGIWHEPHYLVIGFETNGTTLGIFNTTSGNLTTEAAVVSRDLGTAAAAGWHSVDFRYKIDATAGYLWVQWDSETPIYIKDIDTHFDFAASTIFAASCGSLTFSSNDLTYFGSLDNLAFWKPA